MNTHGVVWKRASELFSHPRVFSDGIHPNDINQGGLGDCYFLAVLSALAESEERVRNIFVTQDVNSAGIYLVKFFINGVESPVIIDDYLPTRYNRPCYANSKDGELWVMLLEKAWAKLHGSYSRIESGQCCHAA